MRQLAEMVSGAGPSTSVGEGLAQKKHQPMMGGKAPRKEFLMAGLLKRSWRYQLGIVALCKIHWFQKNTALLIHKLPFSYLVHEIAQEVKKYDMCLQVHPVLTLQEAAEYYLVGLLEDAKLCTIHAKHVMIMPKDIQLAHHIHVDHLHY